MNIQLSQEELTLLVNILTQVQLVYKDSIRVNKLIGRLDSYIELPKAQDVVKNPIEGEVVK